MSVDESKLLDAMLDDPGSNKRSEQEPSGVDENRYAIPKHLNGAVNVERCRRPQIEQG